MHQFSSCQIAGLAMEIEVAGAEFYASLAHSAHGQKLKDVFTVLSEAEIKHWEVFRRIADVCRDDVDEYSIDLAADMRNHIVGLKEIAFSYRSLSKAPANIQEAIDVAIRIETEAIRIYTEIFDSVIEKIHDVLSAIISEEKKHLEILSGLKNKLESGN